MPALYDPDRLAALRALELTEPTSDVAYDRLARLAARSLRVPIALVSFVDDQRQIFCGATGLPEPVATARQTPLSYSFCQHVVVQEVPLIVEDVREHPLMRDNLSIPEFGVVAYAGIPLRTNDGQILGSFCALDLQPRHWTPDDVATLTDFAAATVAEIEQRAAMRSAERSWHEWLGLLESSSEAMFGLDTDARCTYINDAALTFLGYTADECLGRNMHELIHSRHPDGRPYPIEESLIYQALQTGVPVRLREKVLWHKDGRPLATLCSCSPVRQHGVIVGGVVTIVDIGERKRAEEWQQLLSEAGATLAVSLDHDHIFASLAALIVPRVADWCTLDLIGEDGRLTRVAAAHADPAKAILLERLGERYPPAVNDPSPILETLRNGRSLIRWEVTEDDLAALTHDAAHLGLVRELGLDSAIIVLLVARGRDLGVLSLVRAGARRFDAHDLPSIEELTRRCALALDNARLYRQAQEAVLLRDQFVAIASHELRTPVTSIRGYAQLIERQARQGRLNAERVAHHAGLIIAQSTRLGVLIGDLLDASRFQQGRLDLQREQCDLAAVAAEVLGAFRSVPERTARHRIELVAPQPLEGWWDRARLDQVLTNLVSNALKYSPEGGEVCVELRATREGWAELRVSDEGIGIPAEEQAQLFQPFARGAASHGAIGGTGLGLYIVRQIVEGHGGMITVASAPGAGSTFTVRLPRERAER